MCFDASHVMAERRVLHMIVYQCKVSSRPITIRRVVEIGIPKEVNVRMQCPSPKPFRVIFYFLLYAARGAVLSTDPYLATDAGLCLQADGRV